MEKKVVWGPYNCGPKLTHPEPILLNYEHGSINIKLNEHAKRYGLLFLNSYFRVGTRQMFRL